MERRILEHVRLAAGTPNTDAHGNADTDRYADGYTYTGIDTNAYADTNTLGYAYPNAIRDANSDSDANAGAEPGSVQRLELQRHGSLHHDNDYREPHRQYFRRGDR